MTEVAAPVMSEDEAERITRRIALVAGTVRESMEKLHALVDEARRGNAHVALGYRSWTEYLAEVLGAQPLRLEREERRELVGYLAGEGMSNRAIAPVVGATEGTVRNDLRAGAQNYAPEPQPEPEVDLSKVDRDTGEIHDGPFDAERVVADSIEYARHNSANQSKPEPTKVTGRDGKEYSRPAPKTEPSKPRRRPLTDAANDAGWNLRKAAERLTRIREDDRFSRNQEEVASHLRGHLIYAVEVCQDLLDQIDPEGN